MLFSRPHGETLVFLDGSLDRKNTPQQSYLTRTAGDDAIAAARVKPPLLSGLVACSNPSRYLLIIDEKKRRSSITFHESMRHSRAQGPYQRRSSAGLLNHGPINLMSPFRVRDSWQAPHNVRPDGNAMGKRNLAEYILAGLPGKAAERQRYTLRHGARTVSCANACGLFLLILTKCRRTRDKNL